MKDWLTDYCDVWHHCFLFVSIPHTYVQMSKANCSNHWLKIVILTQHNELSWQSSRRSLLYIRNDVDEHQSKSCVQHNHSQYNNYDRKSTYPLRRRQVGNPHVWKVQGKRIPKMKHVYINLYPYNHLQYPQQLGLPTHRLHRLELIRDPHKIDKGLSLADSVKATTIRFVLWLSIRSVVSWS